MITTFSRLCRAVRKITDTKMELTRETKLSALDLDSLGSVQLANELEDDFNTHIDDEDISNWRTIGDVCQTLIKKHGG